jgi:hypothetical protein
LSKNYIIIVKWGLGIGDWGLGIGDWAQSPIPSPIPNPQSPIPNPHVFYIYILKKIYKIKSLFKKIIDYNLLNKSAFSIKTLLCFI